MLSPLGFPGFEISIGQAFESSTFRCSETRFVSGNVFLRSGIRIATKGLDPVLDVQQDKLRLGFRCALADFIYREHSQSHGLGLLRRSSVGPVSDGHARKWIRNDEAIFNF
jgi:hypothetical protein